MNMKLHYCTHVYDYGCPTQNRFGRAASESLPALPTEKEATVVAAETLAALGLVISDCANDLFVGRGMAR